MQLFLHSTSNYFNLSHVLFSIVAALFKACFLSLWPLRCVESTNKRSCLTDTVSVVVLCLSPPGCSVQHLIHYRPGGSGPSLAFHGGRGGHVHSWLRWLHRSAAGKHVSAQVCMFHDKKMLQAACRQRGLCKCIIVHISSSFCHSSLCSWESSFSWSWQRESWHLSLRTGLKTSLTCSSTITFERTGTTSTCRTSSISLRNMYADHIAA